MSRLLEALKRKYPNPRAALRALGLDESLLSEDQASLLHKHASKVIDILLRRHGSQGAVMRKLALDAAMLESDPRGGRAGGSEIYGGTEARGVAREMKGDDIPRKVEEMPEENLSSGWRTADDEEDEPGAEFDGLREHLRKNGLTEDQIEGACKVARDQVRRNRSNGKDRLPVNRVKGGAPGHFGGERPGQRADGAGEIETAREYMRQIDEEGERRAVDGFDIPSQEGSNNVVIEDRARRRGGRDRQAIDEVHRLLRRFGPEAGCRPVRPSEMAASDQVQTMAKQDRTKTRFPGLARIQEV